GIHIFIATSDIHLKHKLMMSRKDVLDAAVWAVTRARKHLEYVEFSAEDASRSDPEYLIEVFGAVIDAGARTVNVPDTTGYALPEEYGALFRMLRERVPGGDRVVWSATATTTSAWRSRTRSPRCRTARASSSAR